MSSKRYCIEEVMSAWIFCSKNLNDGKLWLRQEHFPFSSIFALLHKKGTTCKVCGIEGSHFEVYKNNGKKHIRLATSVPGRYFTVDHTVPKCAGGNGKITNKEPLCTYCNGAWKSRIDTELKGRVAGISIDGENEYLLIID